MCFVNLTPHNIVFRDRNGTDHTIPPCGRVARIGMHSAPAFETYWGNLFTQSAPGRPEGLEEFADWAAAHFQTTGEQVMGIVSSMALDGIAGCADPRWEGHAKFVCAPQTDGTAIRNDQGHIVAVRSFRVAKWAEDAYDGPGIGGN
jgi:hypothetical protein